jgi:tyrosine-protein kinase Etk/Wzc
VLTDKTIRNSHFVSEALKTNLLGTVPNKGGEEKLIDSYRKLRAAVMNQANGKKSFLVADVCENDGAAAVSSGFASAIARSGKKVLLIDANLRTNGVAEILDVKAEKNFYDVLRGTCTAQQAVCDTKVSGLSVIAGAENSEDLADLLASDKFSQLLDELEPNYDEVVVSAPSEVLYPDADNMAKLTGSVMMVAKYASTPYHEFKDSFQRLRTAGGNVIGFVTTAV